MSQKEQQIRSAILILREKMGDCKSCRECESEINRLILLLSVEPVKAPKGEGAKA